MAKPQLVVVALALMLVLVVAACSGPPETQVYIVLSPTHQPPTLTALAANGPITTPSPESATGGDVTATQPATGDVSAFPTAMPTANPLPTALVSQIQVAEQGFEHGRMFWLQPTGSIWVMINAEDSLTDGEWLEFENTFEEGEPENDPSLTPPANLLQPIRGFGALWRDNPEIKEALGWATGPEYGFVTQYEYRPGGYLDTNGNYVPGPGVHVLYSLGRQAFAFEERDNSWRLIE